MVTRQGETATVDGSGIVLAARQLVELLAAVTSFSDEASAARGASERAAQAFEAEVAAVVVDGDVLACVGFPRGQTPVQQLLNARPDEPPVLDVPGAGTCPSLVVWMGDDSGHLLVARAGRNEFTVEDRHLLRGMAQIFQLSLTMIRTLHTERAYRQDLERQSAHNQQLLTELRQHQRLLEHLLGVQQAITQRQPLPQILQTITDAALELLGSEAVGLWLLDPQDPSHAELASFRGLTPDAAEQSRRVQVLDHDLLGTAILQGGPAHGRHPALADPTTGRQARGVAAAVHEGGVVAGAIMAALPAGDGLDQPDPTVLTAFAHHVSLALTDARALQEIRQAHHDALTGLPNRALFLEQFAEELAGAEERDRNLAVCFVDVDRLKWVNDTFGHAAGDQLLIRIVERVQHLLRPGDLVGRLGGDEFALVLRDAELDDALRFADQLLAVVGEPLTIAGEVLRPGASIGVAVRPAYRTDVSSLLRRADEAMYQVKRRRRESPGTVEPSGPARTGLGRAS